MKLLLFDIDGTLMLSGGAGFRAIDRAFETLFGILNATDGVRPDGKTDPLIFREIVEKHGIAHGPGDEVFEQIRTTYEPLMAEEMRSSPARMMPGVEPLLESLAADPDLSLGLLTGNFERTARIKLDRFGLNHHFPFGAFGSDDEDRRCLPSTAVKRAEAHLGSPVGLGSHVLVIGDTPRDVECALVNGATAVGVATGRYNVEQLTQAGAHMVFEDLSDTEEVVKALTSTCP
jgi:phosphoglycolate phosphatase-like HAD superfamily hydrolase